jgi:hypothetical protein
MKTEKTIIKKQKSHAFGKDVYLLGTDSDGIRYWLEHPKWDCGSYWGFGYAETYQRNAMPDKAKDIQSHEHIDTSFTGKCDGDEYVHNIYDCKTLSSVTFTKKEGWVLSDLFSQFYTLKNTAEIFKNGNSNLTMEAHSELIQDLPMVKRINELMIPDITSRIIEILTPKSIKD